MNHDHLSLEVLSALASGERTRGSDGPEGQHLRSCEVCSGRFAQMQRIDEALRNFPIPTTGATFTATVLRTVARSAKTPVIFRLLEHGASVLGVFFVLAAMLSAYLLVARSGAEPQGDGPIGQVMRECNTVMSVARGWIAGHVTAVLGEGSGTLLGVGVAGAVVLLLLDRWLSTRLGER